MESKSLTPHESLDLHEVINFKTLCIAKSKLMQGLVFDQDLKNLMKKDVEQSILALSELQEMYKNGPFETVIPEMRPTPILDGEEGIKVEQ
ncbi:spore gernimation protein GerQ [Niallia sp. Sow4_A1]|jgi:similar to spore coat protein|uniref:Spore gernimation protein GerQ n=1 Tax=Niallia hominis TaxID=3133173 RepID=A0ABV1F2L7_9BACI|nr:MULTISPECIES: hypothetical protein [Bacillaceae]MCF2647472.1 spore gernimation protein GerQ [Niallia circulans]MCM3364582.1 spore gernimation protein GerQ [Niallia sp. MER TA 168]CAI9385889.1 hypothetical protein BACSP_01431 [Bacillus sp. T2.9-1]